VSKEPDPGRSDAWEEAVRRLDESTQSSRDQTLPPTGSKKRATGSPRWSARPRGIRAAGRASYQGDGSEATLTIKATWLHWLEAICLCAGAPLVIFGAGFYVLAAVIAAPLLFLGYRLVTQQLVIDHSGLRVRKLVADGRYPWSEIQGFRLVDHARGFSLSTMGLAGSTVVAILRSGDLKLSVTTSVKGVDQAGDGELWAEVFAREFEALRPA
jgi:hypothetical protein